MTPLVAIPDREALQREASAHGAVGALERQEAATLERGDAPALTGIPPRTVVRLVLHPAAGSSIVVEVWLPDADRWNGRLLGLGNGGAAGGIPTAALAEAVIAGYAAATTDLGTAPSAASGNGNPEVWRDFGHRATHLMTVAAKRLVRAAYGCDPRFSYFQGSSTGGQQAMQEAQRHPDDYDGIVARVPAHCRAPLHAYFLWNRQILAQCPFTAAQRQSVVAAAIEALAARQPAALAGTAVADPRCRTEELAAIIDLARRRDPTLTAAHAEALRRLFAGPRHAVTGERIFGGIPPGAPFEHADGHLYLFNWVFGAERDPLGIDFASDIERYLATLGPDLNAEDADLARFRDRGGRLLIVAGSADAIVPYHATLDYYERLVAHCGSLAAAQAFCRFYLVPGMGHGDEGPGINTLPDLLQAVVDWRERGIVPGVLPGRRVVAGRTELAIDIPPYPARCGEPSVAGPRGGVEGIAARFRC